MALAFSFSLFSTVNLYRKKPSVSLNVSTASLVSPQMPVLSLSKDLARGKKGTKSEDPTAVGEEKEPLDPFPEAVTNLAETRRPLL